MCKVAASDGIGKPSTASLREAAQQRRTRTRRSWSSAAAENQRVAATSDLRLDHSLSRRVRLLSSFARWVTGITLFNSHCTYWHCLIICGAGSVLWDCLASGCLSVCLSHPAAARRCGGLVLWVRRADISIDCCTTGGQQQPRRSSGVRWANAGSARLSADIESWTQTCLFYFAALSSLFRFLFFLWITVLRSADFNSLTYNSTTVKYLVLGSL